METDELKAAWQVLDRRLAQHNDIQLALFRETRLDSARRGLRTLWWGQWLQALLGLGLILLGVACWTQNTGHTGLFLAGILVHAFGVAHIACAGITLGLMATIDYSAPVLRIQKQTALLLRFYTFNANLCGMPWWIMWLPVVVAFAGLGDAPAPATTPAWIWISLAISTAGVAATWLVQARRRRAPHRQPDGTVALHDGSDGIRRSQRILDELTRFEQE